MGSPSGVLSRHLPAESKFSSANPTGSMFRWQDEHTGFARWVPTCCRTVIFLPGTALLSSVGTFGGGCGGGVFIRTARRDLPRIVGDVRFATAVGPGCCPGRADRDGSHPARAPAEPRAVDARDAVVLGQPFVDERVVRIEEPEGALVLPQHAGEEHLGFGAERLPELPSKSGKSRRSGLTRSSKLRTCSHWPTKFDTMTLARLSATMRRTCAFSTAGS